MIVSFSKRNRTVVNMDRFSLAVKTRVIRVIDLKVLAKEKEARKATR